MPEDPYTYGQRTDDPWPATEEPPLEPYVPETYPEATYPEAYAPEPYVPEQYPAESSAPEEPTQSEPFWRSESWLLEPLTDESPAADFGTDGYPDPAPDSAPDPGSDQFPAPAPAPTSGSTAGEADQPTEEYDPAHVPWDLPTDEATEAVKWDDLYEDTEVTGTWDTYQRELDTPTGEPEHRGVEQDSVATNASDFAAQRSAATQDIQPTEGLPGLVHKVSLGRVRMRPKREEVIRRRVEGDIRRNVIGLRQITFTNPKGGSGKTTAALLTSMTLGQIRGGYVLAWDNNETQGTLGVRARPDHHANTVRDLIADLPSFSGPVPGRVGDLAKYVRSQGDAMFDVLSSDEQATAGEMMTAAAFQAVREVVGRFYKLILVDTGNNVRAANWAASIDSTDQLVVTSSVRWESAYSASRMLDYLEQSGRGDLVANAVTVLVMPRSMKGLNLPQVETHFRVRTREVLHAPFDPQLDNGDEIRFASLSEATRQAWLEISAAIVRGL